MCDSEMLRLFKNGCGETVEIKDWNAFLSAADTHTVTGYLYPLFKEKSPSVPAEVSHYIEQLYRQNLVRNMVCLSDMEAVLTEMAHAGIKCMVLKGLRFSERFYGDFGIRNSLDIDFLVAEKDLERAAAVLTAKGYNYTGDPNLIQSSLGTISYNVKFLKLGQFGTSHVELHFHFITSRLGKEINMQEIWQRAVKVPFGKTFVYDLSPPDLLMYLCLHSANHGFETLRHVLDVARAVEVEGKLIDWPQFVVTVKKYGLRNRVFAGLYYAVSLLEASVPEFVLAELKPPPYLFRRLNRECRPHKLPQGLSPVTFGMLRNENLTKFFINICRLAFPSGNKLRVLYNLEHEAQVWTYYPRHWRDLFRRVF